MSEVARQLVEALEFVLTEYNKHSDADTACIEYRDKDHEIWKRVTTALAAAKCEAAPPAVWSREKPTEPGWYWWRSNNHEPRPLHVAKIDGGGFKYQRELGDSWWCMDQITDGYWAGPLRPPVEGKG